MGYKEQAAVMGDIVLGQRVMMSCYKVASDIINETPDPAKPYRYRMAKDTMVNVGGAHSQQMITYLVTSPGLQAKITTAASKVPPVTDGILDADIDTAVSTFWDDVAFAAYGG